MTVSQTMAGTEQADVSPAALEITMGDVATRSLQPRPKPAAGEFGYLHAESGLPVACTPGELVDACRSGKALLIWSPDTAAMVAPPRVPHLGAAILQADVDEARSGRLRALVALAVVSVVALAFPPGWFVAAGAALILWIRNLRVRTAEARTEEDLTWWVSRPESSFRTVAEPSPYTLAMGAAIAAVAAAQIAILGNEWLDGMWQPRPGDGDWLRRLGEPMLHPDAWAMICSGFVVCGLGTALEEEAPRAYLPLSFVAGMAAAAGADLLLTGNPTSGVMAGLMGMAGFYAVLEARHGSARPIMERPSGPLMLVSVSGLVLATYLAVAPVNGAGLLAGIALGLLCVPRRTELAEADALAGQGWTSCLGLGALGLIWLSALAAIASLLVG
jgi:hypothetical protein